LRFFGLKNIPSGNPAVEEEEKSAEIFLQLWLPLSSSLTATLRGRKRHLLFLLLSHNRNWNKYKHKYIQGIPPLKCFSIASGIMEILIKLIKQNSMQQTFDRELCTTSAL
jgi:hypothetical protein